MPKKTNHAVLNMSSMPKLCWEQNVASYHNSFVFRQFQVYNSNEHDLNFEGMEV